MGQQDLGEKALESNEDVFCDIANVLLMQGEEEMKASDLQEADSHSQYKADQKYHEQIRDVVKYWYQNGIRIACLGYENATDTDSDMPLRIISYDGGYYRAQLLAHTGQSASPERYPICTVVLYFGYEHRWNASKRLSDRIHIPASLKHLVQDYSINVIEIAWLEREVIDRLRSDFWFVADYFWQLRKTRTYRPTERLITHPGPLLQMMSALTQDQRFEETYNEWKDKGGTKTMCEVLERIETRGRIEGSILLYDEEMHLPPGEIIRRIMPRFSLDSETAEKYVQKTLGLQRV